MSEPQTIRDPWVKCPSPDPHEPHWHTIRAGNITVAGGRCDGAGR